VAELKKTTSIEYEVTLEGSEEKVVSGKLNDGVLLTNKSDDVVSYEERADKTDVLIASASGILTGLLDVLWVGEFSLRDAQTIGREQINQIVIDIANRQGCTKNTLEDSIRFLEKKYANPSDKLTADFGGTLQHHLRDFSHHASPVGLICSILVQFTDQGYGTDSAGKMLNPEIPENALIGKDFEEKILYGVVYWAFHLASDMAGSSSSAGAGTGIPGPILSLLKELSVLPIFKDIKINYKEEEIPYSAWISKLYNGTAFHHTGYKDIIRFDLRTEIGVADFGAKQSIPVIINQCIVRAFYFINRFYKEIKDKNIKSISDLKTINPGMVLPFNNRCVTRMITVSSGTFTAVDAVDAAVRAKIKSGKDNISFATGFLLRINFVGIANLAIAIKNDARNIVADIREAITGEVKENIIFEAIETQIIDIDAEMDNRAIYRYRFDELLTNVKRNRELTDYFNQKHPKERTLVFDIRTQEFDDYTQMVSYNESWIRYTIERIILTIFEQNNIAYEEAPRVNKHRYFDFIMSEDSHRIGYVFSLAKLHKGIKELYEKAKENTDVNEVCFYFARNVDSKSDDYIKRLNDISEKTYNGYLKFGTLKDFFDMKFGKGEYEIFQEYVDKFNEKARNIIAYKAVVIPTDDELRTFKSRKSEMLLSYDYETLLPSDLCQEQRDILHRNFIDRGLYKALMGDSDFADSFITSEWNYDVNRATGALDQTGIVAGYLKSIEQLLYSLIRLSINDHRSIRLKNGEDGEFSVDNEEYVNSTLGSLIHFVKNNGDILDVNNYTKHYIVDILFDWTDEERNGHFHKDNLHDVNKIEEIRKQTLLLYYLLLGGFKIEEPDYRRIGIVFENGKITDEEDLYQKFKLWALPIVLYDVPSEAGVVEFSIMPSLQGENHWNIALRAMNESCTLDHHWNYDLLFTTTIMSNNFTWDDDVEWEDGLNLIIRMVERLLHEDDPAAKKLRSIPKVIIGDFEVYKTFENS
jgi:hypothetical protein